MFEDQMKDLKRRNVKTKTSNKKSGNLSKDSYRDPKFGGLMPA